MNFFKKMHRSIFDPSFYREIRVAPRSSLIIYFFQLLLFTALLAAVAQTWYFVDLDRGLPRKLAAAFSGIEIVNGRLYAPEQPYVPPSYLVLPLFSQLVGVPEMAGQDADSLIIVDTAASVRIPKKVPVMLLKADRVIVVVNENTKMEFPYTHLLFGERDLKFTVSHIRSFLLRHLISLLFYFFLATIFQQLLLFSFSLFFLAFAAYIFRVERQRVLKDYIKVAFFAVTPMAVGTILVALSGVRTTWTWHILIFLSTIVMFRAIMAINGTIPRGQKADE